VALAPHATLGLAWLKGEESEGGGEQDAPWSEISHPHQRCRSRLPPEKAVTKTNG